MKKFITGLVIGLLLSLPIASFANSQALRLVVNGEDITAIAQPIIIDGRTLVPTRALAEKLGATVEWDSATNTVIVNGDIRTDITPTPTPIGDAVNIAEWVRVKDLSSQGIITVIGRDVTVVSKGDKKLVFPLNTTSLVEINNDTPAYFKAANGAELMIYKSFLYIKKSDLSLLS